MKILSNVRSIKQRGLKIAEEIVQANCSTYIRQKDS